jgi:hypothetical protein
MAEEPKGTIPEKNTTQWKKNEKLITKHPTLRAARDVTEGFTPTSGVSTGVNDQAYKDGYDKIEWGKNKTKPKFKVRINGKVINDEET